MLSSCLRQIAFHICRNTGLGSPGQHLTSIARRSRAPSVSGGWKFQQTETGGRQAFVKLTAVAGPMPLTACSLCLQTIGKWLPRSTTIQTVHTLQPRGAGMVYCCLAVTPTGFINCILHASAALWKAFLREGASPWNRTLKLKPLATADTRSTWTAMPCEKGTVKSCCHSYATPTFQPTKGTGFWLASWLTAQQIRGAGLPRWLHCRLHLRLVRLRRDLNFHLLGLMLQVNYCRYRWLILNRGCLVPLTMLRLYSWERESRPYFGLQCSALQALLSAMLILCQWLGAYQSNRQIGQFGCETSPSTRSTWPRVWQRYSSSPHELTGGLGCRTQSFAMCY